MTPASTRRPTPGTSSTTPTTRTWSRAPTTRSEPRGGGARSRPPCLGLTGGIGSGKSAALDAFARRGAAVLSSDAVVHELYRDPAVREAVVTRFGPMVLTPGGEVDRAALGRRAFAEEGGIGFLEDLLHPRVGAARERWVRERAADRPPPPLLVCEIPLLFETGSPDRFDAVLVVTAPEAVRRARVEARGQSFAERVGRQWDEARKVAAADRAYVNDGGLADLDAWVGERFAEYATPGRGAPR